MSILEDSGYMARVAFVMDKLFRRFGLSVKTLMSINVRQEMKEIEKYQ